MEDLLLTTKLNGGQTGIETQAETWVNDLGELLRLHKGADVLVLDIRPVSDWTDFFIIATAASNAHLDGLERRTKEFCKERDIEIFRRSSKNAKEGDGWRIIDLGTAVVHLMNKDARDFYELERLWAVPL